MSERYTKLFALPDGQELYGEGSPVLIAAGVLSKDNQTKNTLVQLKFRSIERRIIRELTVRVQPIDADGAPLGEVEHRYQELSAELEEEFGAKSPIFLNSAGVRSFSVRVTGAVFTDGTVWQDENADWGLLPEKSEIQNVGWEPELRKQFRMEYRTESGYLPWHARGLWLCPCCGKLNRETAEECYSCQTQKPGPDYLETLCQHMNARLEEERKAAAEAAAAAEERRKETAKKAKKIGKIAAIVAVLVVAAVVVYQTVIKNMLAYQDAEQLAQQGEYEEAIAAFEALGDYKDSAEQIEAVKYAWAQAKEAEEDYSGAAELYHELGDYQDSSEREKTVKNEERYQLAMEYLEEGKAAQNVARNGGDPLKQAAIYYPSMMKARDQLIALGDYKDAAEYVKHFVWRQIGVDSETDSDKWQFRQYDDNGDFCGICENEGYFKYVSGDGQRTVRRADGKQILEYDEQGNLISLTEGSKKHTYTYDFNEDGSIAHRYEKYVDGDDTADGVVEYEYNEGYLAKTVEEYISSSDREDGKVPWTTTSIYYYYEDDYAGDEKIGAIKRTVTRGMYSKVKNEWTDVYGWVYAPNATE